MPESLKLNHENKSALNLNAGQSSTIKELQGPIEIVARLREMGFIPGASLSCTMATPLGGPRIYKTGNFVVALRESEAKCLILT